MAGDWLLWRKGLTQKPKVKIVAAICGVSKQHAAAAVMLLHEWLDANTSKEDVNAEGDVRVTVGPLHIDDIDVTVGTSHFGKALQEVGWLIAKNGVWTFPHFADHNGQTAKDRALTAKRNQKYRDARVTLARRSRDEIFPTTEQNRTEHTIQKTTSSGRTRKSGPTRTPISLNRSTWAWEGITPEDRRLWSAANPAVNLDKELAAMVAWCRSNGARGQKRNWPAFITRWLAKAQDRGGPNAGDNGKAAQALPYDIPEDCR